MFWPFEKVEVDSPLPTEALEQRLRDRVENKFPLLGGLFYSGSREFRGELEAGRFKILRITGYRRSVFSVAVGDYYAIASGSRVSIRFRLSIFYAFFWFFWMALMSIGTLATLGVRIKGPVKLELFIPLGMLIFGYLMCMIPFNIDVKKTKVFLRRVLKAEISGL